jgi:hypothetical protein
MMGIVVVVKRGKFHNLLFCNLRMGNDYGERMGDKGQIFACCGVLAATTFQSLIVVHPGAWRLAADFREF